MGASPRHKQINDSEAGTTSNLVVGLVQFHLIGTTPLLHIQSSSPLAFRKFLLANTRVKHSKYVEKKLPLSKTHSRSRPMKG